MTQFENQSRLTTPEFDSEHGSICSSQDMFTASHTYEGVKHAIGDQFNQENTEFPELKEYREFIFPWLDSSEVLKLSGLSLVEPQTTVANIADSPELVRLESITKKILIRLLNRVSPDSGLHGNSLSRVSADYSETRVGSWGTDRTCPEINVNRKRRQSYYPTRLWRSFVSKVRRCAGP